MIRTRSFTSLLIRGAVILHLILTPILFSGILLYIKNSYTEQFIDAIRSSTSLIAGYFSKHQFTKDITEIKEYLDELLLSGKVSFAEIHLDDGQILKSEEFGAIDVTFNEDFYFGQHNDHTYFIKARLSEEYGSETATLLLGFDEELTQEQIDTTLQIGVYVGIGYLVVTVIVLLIIIPRATNSLKLIQKSAKKIASGDNRETLNIQSNIGEVASLVDDLEKMRLELVSQKENIEKREHYISAIMENMSEPMIILNRDLSIHSINPAAEMVFQYRSEEVTGKSYAQLITQDAGSRNQSKLEVQINALARKSVQCYGIRGDGGKFPVELKYSTFENGSEQLIICTAHDMTEHKKHEEELIVARSNAEIANKSKSIFLSSMSHELRTPLNAIIGYSEILLEEAQDRREESAVSDLTKIRNSGTHLLSLINNILDLSKVEAGKMELDIQKFEIAHMIEDIVFTTKPLIEKNQNQFLLEINTDLKELISDYTKIKQILINLIGNAAKFTDSGTISLVVSDETTDAQQYILFVVSDTGIGISEKDQKNLFKEFSQANTKITTNYGGTGLGLAICRRFCQLMQGDITLESAPEEGSKFLVKLPVDISENIADGTSDIVSSA